MGAGLGLTVAPLTAAVLVAVSDDQLGQAPAINNAAAQVGVLLLVTLVPALIGVGADDLGQALASGYQPAMWVMGGLVVAAAVITGLFFSDCATDAPRMPPQPQIHSCVLPVGAPARTPRQDHDHATGPPGSRRSGPGRPRERSASGG